ncbi:MULTISPECIES: FAD-dependent oxidoreductase [Prauserella salsuginis group]|uniref:2-polyprenyl-6-methoxyphenol hydroxylase-like FAD-dependent oxidoreductase n=2 Tax=Prauserella salsuginis group TaxID=2893672 RepID=A0A839XNH9_9PSEU|nr:MULTISPECIES: FAD-dependent oxidoreductase [Prauserella salsuginis group]MBB3661485.1 2-polyprenyl-6-methoxyphenol hydroxylase-like FAD-dependent oxidoreductase [Prauserella sediminis]MCR3719406.1 2-polyprenyl-6-methoxyphenol hydroxylase [Prauserella flava]MCR3735580.1 2-polyprenyl-6-methoxyphenol hydroxylase [Prauserella salsuginis]
MTARTNCVIAGGGPAGMVLGLLLARAGIEVTVLEKHGDFLRDFRGDTVHPSTQTLLDELGLGEEFATLPQTRLHEIAFPAADGTSVVVGDLRRLARWTRHPYIALTPQWDLLNLLAKAGADEPTFTLRMNTEVTGLLRQEGRVVGVRYRGQDGEGELRADLTVAADGRWSFARREVGLTPKEWPVPFDVWWFRLGRDPDDTTAALSPTMRSGRFVLDIPREGFHQLAYLGRKGTDGDLRRRGVEAFRRDIAEVLPHLSHRVGDLTSMDDVKHLDVRLNRLPRWHTEGLLCIGDAAHAMSPIGGVGINLAVQDAVAAARLLAGPLRRGTPTAADLAAVRKRRLLPTAAVQTLQRLMHRMVAAPVVEGRRLGPPKPVQRLLRRVPALSLVPAYLVGIGLRPEQAPEFARRRP